MEKLTVDSLLQETKLYYTRESDGTKVEISITLVSEVLAQSLVGMQVMNTLLKR